MIPTDTPDGFDFWKGLAAALGGASLTVLYLLVGLIFWLPQGQAPWWADGPLYLGVFIMAAGPAWFWIGRPAWRWGRRRWASSRTSSTS